MSDAPIDFPQTRTPERVAVNTLATAMLIAVGSFVLYFFTAAPGVLWGDSGILQIRVYFDEWDSPLGLALAHPLYILTARLWTKMFDGDFAWRVNLYSAACSSFALAVVYLFVARWTQKRFAALLAAVTLAVSHTFWTHAVLAECYALYGLALAAELVCVQSFARSGKRGWWYAALLVNGLNLSNHLLALLHLPGYAILTFFLIKRRRLIWRHVAIAAVFWLAGAALYLGMIAGEIVVRGEWVTVLREALFGTSFAGELAGARFDVLRQLIKTIAAFGWNFATPAALLAISGLLVAIRAIRTQSAAALPAMLMLSILLVNSAFGFTYTVPDQYVFFYPSYIVIAVLIGLGAARFVRTRWRGAMLLPLCMLPALVYEAVPPYLHSRDLGLQSVRNLPRREKYRYFLRPRKNNEYGPINFATSVFNIVSPHDLVIADSSIKAVLAYVRDIDGQGVRVVLNDGGGVPARMPVATISPETVDRYVAESRAFLCDDAGPAYVSPWFHERYDFQEAGEIWKLMPKTADMGKVPRADAVGTEQSVSAHGSP